ncbi:DUF4231 domain-containing protein [Shewanella algae]|uniref:DUF4231 domain-containing protein n=1 Tax=Shewanella algae TaxID=38313 RepID=UPI0031F572D2
MESEKIQAYIKDRVEDQMLWYEKQAHRAKTRSLNLQVIQLVCLFMIPMFLLGSEYFGLSNYVSSLISSGLAVYAALATMVSNVLKLDTKWEQYRFISEQLKRELMSYRMDVGEYHDLPQEIKERAFVEKVEQIAGSELSRWFVGERRGGR